jgi:ribose 5-phosphate isomerase RpiB
VAEAIDIDQIVREVLKRLRALSTGVSEPGAPPAKSQESAAVTSVSSTLTFSGRLVTLAALEGRLIGLKQLVVGPKTIVTPAVKDELKKRGITIVQHESALPQTLQVRLLVSAAGGAQSKPGLRADLNNATPGIEWLECQATNSLSGTVLELSKNIDQRKLLGLLLSDQPFTAAMLANRNQNIRAAAVDDVRSVDEALCQIGCNLLAVDARRVGPAVLKLIVQKLAAAQAVCPPELIGK